MRLIVTGSSGLVGSEAVLFFDEMGFETVGVDNNMRRDFFGPNADTTWNRDRLEAQCSRFRHVPMDIRDRQDVDRLVAQVRPTAIVHAAAQPSHDLAAKRPFDDFDVNALGTLNLLEATRRHAPQAAFVYLSTNKVYGDGPNNIPMRELETRWDYAEEHYRNGISENFSIDQCTHSLFGASKVAADVMVQEYGRDETIQLNTGVFRGGCLTGPQHAGVELHGFLNYLVSAAVNRRPYTILGYLGKQVRDQLHARDVGGALWEFIQSPRPGEVYNLGGGKSNSASILECIELIAELSGGCRPQLSYDEKHRIGDHQCYYTDLAKFRSHYPQWQMQYSLPEIVAEILDATRSESRKAA